MPKKVRKLGHHVVGVDVVEIPGVLDRVDEFHLFDLAGGSDQSLGSDYDVVILGDVIEHLPDPLASLRRAVGLLRPGGEVVLSVPNFGHCTCGTPQGGDSGRHRARLCPRPVQTGRIPNKKETSWVSEGRSASSSSD